MPAAAGPQLRDAIAATKDKFFALLCRSIGAADLLEDERFSSLLSRGANLYNRVMLGVRIKDATGGFRVYKAGTLRKIDLNSIDSAGYCFQIDMTLRVLQAGLVLTEVPITFVERELGASKMSRTVIIEAFTRVAQWGITARLHGHSAASVRK